MDWITKLEEKKKIRTMAGRMLWADFRSFVCGWQVVFLLLEYLGLFLIPYIETEDYNVGAFYYCAMWVYLGLNAQFETAFNYLPLSTKQIRYYLRIRNSYLEAGMVFLSVVTASGMQLLGFAPLWERGLLVLLFLLMTNEWIALYTMYGYSKPEEVGLFDQKYPARRRFRMICYNLYSVAAFVVTLIYLTVTVPGKQALRVMLLAYLILFFMREDVRHWVSFPNYTKVARKGMLSMPKKQSE